MISNVSHDLRSMENNKIVVLINHLYHFNLETSLMIKHFGVLFWVNFSQNTQEVTFAQNPSYAPTICVLSRVIKRDGIKHHEGRGGRFNKQ